MWLQSSSSLGRRKDSQCCYDCFEYPTPEYTIRACRLQRQHSDSDLVTVMFHGLGTQWDLWNPLILNLTLPLNIFSLDLPWSGQQGNLWGLKTSTFEWVRLGLKTVKADPSILIAHSFGANALLEYLSTNPIHSVKALILISPFYKPSNELINWSIMEYYVKHFPDLLEAGLQVHPKAKLIASETLVAMVEKIRDRIGPQGWLQFFNMYVRTPELNLNAFQMPCLELGGEDDFASFPSDCQDLAKNLPKATVEILPDCGHFCVLEKTQTVMFIIENFLQQSLNIKNYTNKE
jgi:pimeloyl-ACP methyl ester carboxylesterase